MQALMAGGDGTSPVPHEAVSNLVCRTHQAQGKFGGLFSSHVGLFLIQCIGRQPILSHFAAPSLSPFVGAALPSRLCSLLL